jgi:hexokinase
MKGNETFAIMTYSDKNKSIVKVLHDVWYYDAMLFFYLSIYIVDRYKKKVHEKKIFIGLSFSFPIGKTNR